MNQMTVTIEDASFAGQIRQAISMLRGVTSVTMVRRTKRRKVEELVPAETLQDSACEVSDSHAEAKQAAQEEYVRKSLTAAWEQVKAAQRDGRALPDAHGLLNLLDD